MKPEGANESRGFPDFTDEPFSTEEIPTRRVSTSPRVMYVFAVAGVLFASFYVVWFLNAYDEPNWPMAGVALAGAVILLSGLPLARTKYTTTTSVIALSFATILLVWFTSELRTSSNVHMCLLAVGFALLALVPEYMHVVRASFSGVVIPLLIASEFIFRPTLPLSADDAERNEILSNVNRIWTVVVVVGAMAIIRYRNSHRQQDLSGAAELGEFRANTDPMTGLNNRRPILNRLRELDAAETHGYAIALIDIDSFKAINDRLGHEEGDALISAIARRLRAHFRQTDLVSRWGGDEFLVLLSSVEPGELHTVLERLRASIAESPFSLGESPIQVTLSIGVAISCPTMSSQQTVSAADRALYTAKHTGRNRVVMADHAQTSVSENR